MTVVRFPTPGLSGLTDEDLIAETRRAYEAHMRMEMAGNAYLSNPSGAAHARSYYYRCATEMGRRNLNEGDKG